jgi:hypothetical protein
MDRHMVVSPDPAVGAVTDADLAFEDDAQTLSEPPPETSALLPADLDERKIASPGACHC